MNYAHPFLLVIFSRIVADINAAQAAVAEEFPHNGGWVLALWLLRKTHIFGDQTKEVRKERLDEEENLASLVEDPNQEDPNPDDEDDAADLYGSIPMARRRTEPQEEDV